MAMTATLISGPSGVSGPNAAGEFAEETWEVAGDGSATTLTVTPRWLRTLDAAIGTTATVIISNATPPGTAALTFATALGNGLKQYLVLRGRR